MDERAASARVSTARESNGAAAAAELWQALDTTHCGRHEIVRDFFATLPADQTIVDIGCWNGSIAALAARCIGGDGSDGNPARAPWTMYTGVDVVPAALDHFRSVHAARPRTQVVEGDVRALPLPDASADVVLCLFVLQDMEGYRADGLGALREIVRVARPGARLLLGLTVNALHEEDTYYVVKKLRRRGIPEKPTHHWHGPEFLAALRSGGMTIGKLDGFGPNDRGFVELYVRAVAKPRNAGRHGARPSAVPIDLMPAAPELFLDYVRDFDRVGELFAHDFRAPESFASAADAAAARDLPRHEVADVLDEQHRMFAGGEPARRNIDRLRDSQTVAVLTGQQPAVFGGPLYNLYKAATAVRLASRLERETGRAHVPVFWIANDDHVLSGVDHIHALSSEGNVTRISWRHGREHATEPIGAVRVDGDIEAALERLASTARASPEALALLSETFRAGERLSDCFARLLLSLFESEGLVAVDPSDPRLRRLGLSPLAPELDFPSPTAEAARVATARLATLGYSPQVSLRNDRLNLFIGRSQRFRIRASVSGFQLSHGTAPVPREELRARFAAAPEEFSPNVLLRPLYQDGLFPTVAYVAGPSEIGYYAQLQPVYSSFGLPMPVIYPRKSAILINDRAQRALDCARLGVDDVLRDVAALGSSAFTTGNSRWLYSYIAPDGNPQERVLGTAYALLAMGLELVPEVLSRLRLDEFDQQLVSMGNAEPRGTARVG